MSYDVDLADRIRAVVGGEPELDEKRMFGGLAFLVDGHMAVAASGQGGILLRCDPADTDRHVEQPGVDRFVMRGKPMDGWLHVQPEAVGTENELQEWVGHGLRYARSLGPA